MGQSENSVAILLSGYSFVSLRHETMASITDRVFPKVITENFGFTNCEETPDSINYWLEERDIPFSFSD